MAIKTFFKCRPGDRFYSCPFILALCDFHHKAIYEFDLERQPRVKNCI